MIPFQHLIVRIFHPVAFFMLAVRLSLAAPVAPPPGDPEMEAFINDLLSRMTLEEKCGQLTQSGGKWENTVRTEKEKAEAKIRAGQVGSFLSVHGAELTGRLQRIAVEESRLGIPLLFAHDVIHGFRTIFPVPLGSASSWDPAAIEKAARVAAVEATASGVHWTYAPMVDIGRDPRWGRIVEGAGEDPYLGSAIAAAQVRGFQGSDLAHDDTLLACAKHFAAYGGAEAGRDYNIVDISEQTLREVYLPPFEAATHAGVRTFMAAFNEIGGVPSHASSYLLQDILRGEWGYTGLVVSDYTGIEELMDHGVAADKWQAGTLALKAGVDIDMVSEVYLQLSYAIEAGFLDEAIIDQAVRRVLELKYRLGLFEDPYRYHDTAREHERILTAEHRAVARSLAQKSMVLLKNDAHTLPYSKEVESVAVIGPLGNDRASTLGNWSGAGREDDAVTVFEGIWRARPEAHVQYVAGCSVWNNDTSGIDRAVTAARDSEVVVLVIGEHRDMSAEAKSRTILDLPGAQQALAEAVLSAGKPTVVVLMNGRPLCLPWLEEHAPAILETWYLGVETGNAVADVIFGDVNPSGKLPITFPRTTGQIPIYYNHRNTGRPADPFDPYTSKYLDVSSTPLYPFGHGLSYTTFAYEDIELSTRSIPPDGTLTVTAQVRNTGSRPGVEVVQLYLRDLVGSTTRPVRELKGFQRVALEPGEMKEVAFRIGPAELSIYTGDRQWKVEPGDFKVFVGGNSQATMQADFRVETPPSQKKL